MKFKQIKILFLISILTLFFSVVIFFVKSFYFNYDITLNEVIEKKFIEPNNLNSSYKSLYDIVKQEKSPIDIKSNKIKYSYLPNSFKTDKNLEIYKKPLDKFLNYKPIYEKINFLEIFLYKDIGEVRGKMKDKKIHISGVLSMNRSEFVSVFIHEFAHFLDLYILKKGVYTDLSEYFYAISWKSIKIKKSTQTQKDFVSGYAMTNKYEDFAESFTYYVLHNKDFLEKAKKSSILKRKYDFFSRYVFRNEEFKKFIDNKQEKIKDYYWDITKIDFDLYDFENYLQK